MLMTSFASAATQILERNSYTRFLMLEGQENLDLVEEIVEFFRRYKLEWSVHYTMIYAQYNRCYVLGLKDIINNVFDEIETEFKLKFL